MEQTIMMSTTSLDGPYFDATRWFASGMYKRRKEVISEKEIDSDVSMFRVNPPPFREKEDIYSWAAYSLERYYPHEVNDRNYLYEKRPDLRHRMVYIASGFDKPDKPVDGYELYLTIGERRYTIDFDRDGVTGEIVEVGGAFLVRQDDKKMERFKKLEEAERER